MHLRHNQELCKNSCPFSRPAALPALKSIMLVSLDFSEAAVQINGCPSPAARPAPCENRLVFSENDKQAILRFYDLQPS